ncbi:hypothetical protein GOZ79_20165, partial [Agrobacterium vitis]|nr:hypothetical protein [Agrobacterium vitis]
LYNAAWTGPCDQRRTRHPAGCADRKWSAGHPCGSVPAVGPRYCLNGGGGGRYGGGAGGTPNPAPTPPEFVRPRTLSVETTALLRQIGTMLTEAQPLAPALRAALD